MREYPVATLTIHRAGDMTDEGRKAIAAWLRRQAYFLANDGENYADHFRARYCHLEMEDGDGQDPKGIGAENVGAGRQPPVLPEGLSPAE